MRLHDLSGDGESNAFAAGITVAGLGDPIEGLEYAFQIPGGDPGAAVADQNRDIRAGPRDGNVDARVLGAVAYGVAQHVLDGASHQVAVAVDGGLCRALEPDPAILDGPFEVRVAHHFFDHFVEVEGFAHERCIRAVQPRELQNLADQGVETFDLALQAVQLARQVGGRLAGQSEGYTHSRPGGT